MTLIKILLNNAEVKYMDEVKIFAVLTCDYML